MDVRVRGSERLFLYSPCEGRDLYGIPLLVSPPSAVAEVSCCFDYRFGFDLLGLRLIPEPRRPREDAG